MYSSIKPMDSFIAKYLKFFILFEIFLIGLSSNVFFEDAPYNIDELLFKYVSGVVLILIIIDKIILIKKYVNIQIIKGYLADYGNFYCDVLRYLCKTLRTNYSEQEIKDIIEKEIHLNTAINTTKLNKIKRVFENELDLFEKSVEKTNKLDGEYKKIIKYKINEYREVLKNY
jgi:hypothetical protein